MKKNILLVGILMLFACETSKKETPKNSTEDISVKEFREFKVLDSENLNFEKQWEALKEEMKDFTEDQYQALKPLILEKSIPEINAAISKGQLNYEKLMKFYLYRIKKFDRNNELSLNSVIAINPNAIKNAKEKDRVGAPTDMNSLNGMPILLKDNINTKEMPTTAGAVALKNNNTEDAFIVTQLKNAGAIILGKANLSEWAYFFCGDCPSGYSAIGGQTLNPYGRKTIDTGGSSSGSGVAVAANFCIAAIGSETAGSILSPSSQNSVVGLKPTIGLVSRSGIIPISSTLDTAGPITKNVIDNGIVLKALVQYDADDSKSNTMNWDSYSYILEERTQENALQGKKFGAYKRLLEDSLYVATLEILKKQGAEIVELEQQEIDLPKFINLLNLDMKKDLPEYFEKYGNTDLGLHSVADVVAFNQKDSVKAMPYGQKLFHGIIADVATEVELEDIKKALHENGIAFFNKQMEAHNLDAVLSINNYHAAYAAVAEYPALTVPMGYTDKGEPEGLTFIGKPFTEGLLLFYASVYEQYSKQRKSPKNYN